MSSQKDHTLNSCKLLMDTLKQIQSRAGFNLLTRDASEWLSKVFSDKSKKVQSVLAKRLKSSTKCSVCESPLVSGGSLNILLSFEIDWDEQECVPSRLIVCCDECRRLLDFNRFMNIYLCSSLKNTSDEYSEENSQLSTVIEKFLKLNKYKISEVKVFNAAVSLSVSLKKQLEALNMEPSSNADLPLEEYLAKFVSV